MEAEYLKGLDEHTHLFLTFTSAERQFALPLSDVREIIFYRHVSPLPLMPKLMRGIYNLRGKVLPVLDLAIRLGQEASPISKRSSIVICELNQGTQIVGFLVDTVCDVLPLNPEQIEPAPAFGAELPSDFIAGVANYADEFIVILAAERVLQMSELAELSRQAQIAVSQNALWGQENRSPSCSN